MGQVRHFDFFEKNIFPIEEMFNKMYFYSKYYKVKFSISIIAG